MLSFGRRSRLAGGAGDRVSFEILNSGFCQVAGPAFQTHCPGLSSPMCLTTLHFELRLLLNGAASADPPQGFPLIGHRLWLVQALRRARRIVD